MKTILFILLFCVACTQKDTSAQPASSNLAETQKKEVVIQKDKTAMQLVELLVTHPEIMFSSSEHAHELLPNNCNQPPKPIGKNGTNGTNGTVYCPIEGVKTLTIHSKESMPENAMISIAFSESIHCEDVYKTVSQYYQAEGGLIKEPEGSDDTCHAQWLINQKIKGGSILLSSLYGELGLSIRVEQEAKHYSHLAEELTDTEKMKLVEERKQTVYRFTDAIIRDPKIIELTLEQSLLRLPSSCEV